MGIGYTVCLETVFKNYNGEIVKASFPKERSHYSLFRNGKYIERSYDYDKLKRKLCRS